LAGPTASGPSNQISIGAPYRKLWVDQSHYSTSNGGIQLIIIDKAVNAEIFIKVL